MPVQKTASNLRLALILGSIAVIFFIGIIIKNILF
jgi:hypothetical protein